VIVRFWVVLRLMVSGANHEYVIILFTQTEHSF